MKRLICLVPLLAVLMCGCGRTKELEARLRNELDKTKRLQAELEEVEGELKSKRGNLELALEDLKRLREDASTDPSQTNRVAELEEQIRERDVLIRRAKEYTDLLKKEKAERDKKIALLERTVKERDQTISGLRRELVSARKSSAVRLKSHSSSGGLSRSGNVRRLGD